MGKTTHGRSHLPEYRSWRAMQRRCHTDTKSKSWKRYGGRGIQVCDEWRNSFDAFYRHIGPKPTPAHSLDRFPNRNGNYEPGNVRWATWKEQMINRDFARHAQHEILHPLPPGVTSYDILEGLFKFDDLGVLRCTVED